MRFFSNCTLTGEDDIKHPAGSIFEVVAHGGAIEPIQGNPAIHVYHLRSGVKGPIVKVYNTHGRLVEKSSYIRYPTILGLSVALGYHLDISKMNQEAMERQEVLLKKYRLVTPKPLDVVDVSLAVLDAYEARSRDYEILNTYQHALREFRDIFNKLQSRKEPEWPE